MSARLTHSPEAFLRMMQISQVEVFVFVEGDTDVFFYGLLCDRAYGANPSYRLHSVAELRGPAGKAGLLAFFRYLGNIGKLCHRFKGMRKIAAFCLDKDIDDLTGELVESPHLIRGALHSVENYIFMHGDVPKALAAVASLDVATVRQAAVGGDEWRRAAALNYQCWTELCICARKHGLNGPANYSSPSRVQTAANAPVDDVLRDGFLVQLQLAVGVSETELRTILAEIAELVAERIENGRADEIFKGRWYGYFVAEEARTFGRSMDIKAFWKVLQVTLDFAATWADDFIVKFQSLLNCEALANLAQNAGR